MARRLALFLTGWLACAGAQAQARRRQPSVATAIAGILSYTRWPTDATSIRLCTLGRGAAVEEIQRSAEIGSAQRSVTIRALAGVAQVRGACDAIYVAGQEPALGRELLKATAGQPVLVLGEGAEFCSDGGMFCLEPGGPRRCASAPTSTRSRAAGCASIRWCCASRAARPGAAP